jgi:hypothetical protein
VQAWKCCHENCCVYFAIQKSRFRAPKIYKTNLKVFAFLRNGSIPTQASLKSHVQQLQLHLAL